MDRKRSNRLPEAQNICLVSETVMDVETLIETLKGHLSLAFHGRTCDLYIIAISTISMNAILETVCSRTILLGCVRRQSM